jgi:hypothetical protein
LWGGEDGQGNDDEVIGSSRSEAHFDDLLGWNDSTPSLLK